METERVGIDCEFYTYDCSSFDNNKTATLQIATKDQVYILDCIDMKTYAPFLDFVKNLMENPKILKIAHSFDGDINVFNESFEIKIDKPAGIINIEKIYQKRAVSLQKMVRIFLDKDMCKFEQISSWSKRPLKKTQLHYAGLDAVVVLAIYDKLMI